MLERWLVGVISHGDFCTHLLKRDCQAVVHIILVGNDYTIAVGLINQVANHIITEGSVWATR